MQQKVCMQFVISQLDRDKLCAAMGIGSDDYCCFVRLKAEFPLTN